MPNNPLSTMLVGVDMLMYTYRNALVDTIRVSSATIERKHPIRRISTASLWRSAKPSKCAAIPDSCGSIPTPTNARSGR